MKTPPATLALVLGGGGARAAYQAGFLRSISRSFPDLRFPVLTGVSAGAINAVHLASSPDGFPLAAEQLVALWRRITTDQVFRTDFPALAVSMARWALRLVSGGARLSPPARGLVHTAPLHRFLREALHTDDGVLHGVERNLRDGRLSAIGITTTNYTTGQSTTWTQGNALRTWYRPGRCSQLTTLTVEHVMASCALPLFFPAARIGDDWHGDGSIQLTAPLSPALHLGADRILAISTRYAPTSREAARTTTDGYPPPAAIIGLLLNSAFLDMLDQDAITMQRINQLLRDHPYAGGTGFRHLDLLLLRPSQDLGLIANEFEAKLPRSFRFATRGLGTRETRRADLLATLLFQPDYIARLIEIGERDGERRRDEIAAFLTCRPGDTALLHRLTPAPAA